MDFSSLFKILLDKIDTALQVQKKEVIDYFHTTAMPDLILSHTAQPWRANKNYPMNALVVHRGGLWTTPIETSDEPSSIGASWLCLLNGVFQCDFQVSPDDPRHRGLAITLSDGQKSSFDWQEPLSIHCGTYMPDQEYHPGDEVASDGSLWRATRSTKSRPPGEDWLLCASRGARGKRAREESQS